eukprot:20864-Heterococcus_DN1.PRE.4
MHQAGKMVTAGGKHTATALKQQQQDDDEDDDDEDGNDSNDDLGATNSKAKAPPKKTTDAARDKLMTKLTDLAELCCKIGGPDPPAITQLLSDKTVAKGVQHATAADTLGLRNTAIALSQAQSGQSQDSRSATAAVAEAAAVDVDDGEAADLLDFDLYADSVQRLQPVPHGLLLSYVKLVLPFTLPEKDAEQPVAVAAAVVTHKQPTAARASTVSTEQRLPHSDIVASHDVAVMHYEHDGQHHDDGYEFLQEDAGGDYDVDQDTWNNPAVPAKAVLPIQIAATAATTPYSKGKSPAIAPRRSAITSSSKVAAAAAAAVDDIAAVSSSSKKTKQMSKQKSKKSTTTKRDEDNTIPFVLSLTTARAYLAELQEASDAAQHQITGSGRKKPRIRKDANSMSSEPFLLPRNPVETQAQGFKGLVMSSSGSSSNPSSRLTAMLDAAVRGELQLPLDIERLKRAAAANSDGDSGDVNNSDDSVWGDSDNDAEESYANKQQQQQQEQLQANSSDDNDELLLNSSRTASKPAKAQQRSTDTAVTAVRDAAQGYDDVLDSDNAEQHDGSVHNGDYEFGGNEYDYNDDDQTLEYSKVDNDAAVEQRVGGSVSEATVQAAPVAVMEATTTAARQFSSSYSSSAVVPQSTSARVPAVTAHINAKLAQISIGSSTSTTGSSAGSSNTVQIRVDEPAALMANGGSAHAVAALVFAVHESNCIAGGSGTQRALTLVSAATAAAAATDDVDSDSMSDSSGNGCNGSKQYGVAIQVSKVK